MKNNNQYLKNATTLDKFQDLLSIIKPFNQQLLLKYNYNYVNIPTIHPFIYDLYLFIVEMDGEWDTLKHQDYPPVKVCESLVSELNVLNNIILSSSNSNSIVLQYILNKKKKNNINTIFLNISDKLEDSNITEKSFQETICLLLHDCYYDYKENFDKDDQIIDWANVDIKSISNDLFHSALAADIILYIKPLIESVRNYINSEECFTLLFEKVCYYNYIIQQKKYKNLTNFPEQISNIQKLFTIFKKSYPKNIDQIKMLSEEIAKLAALIKILK